MPQETTTTWGELIKGNGQKFGPYAYRQRGANPDPKQQDNSKEINKGKIGATKRRG